MYRVSAFVRYFARALLAGIALATLLVNTAPALYYDAIEWRLFDLPFPEGWTALPTPVTPLSLVSGGLMALVLALLGKEFWEALALETGVLRRDPKLGRPALLPLAAVLGGAGGAVLVWLLMSAALPIPLESWPGAGWPVPIGADVVLAYAAGRLTFGPGHPALHLLLLITVAFDVLGLLVAGLTDPAAGLMPAWLALPLAATLAVWTYAGRHAHPGASERLKRRAAQLWPYALAGLISWAGVALSGLPGALGLLPLIPVIPHASRTFGLFAEAEAHLHDPLNRLAQIAVGPVTVTLFLFGLTHGGLDFQAAAPTSLTTLAAFLIGKPMGLLAGLFAVLALGAARLPGAISRADLGRLAVLSAMGFTIPALAMGTSLPGGAMTEAARLGLAATLLPGAALALWCWARRRATPGRT
jgi:NhaA family Na+:H+ antiporter